MRGVSRILGFSLLLVSMAPAAWGWGQIGHRASAYVAEAFLTPQSKQALQQLLKKQRLADIATWADTLRGDDTLKHISPYHYEGVRDGVAYMDHLKRMPRDEVARGGVLQAILVAERQLEDPGVPMKQKEIALRFLVHFIGDIHQPLHSGRPEDKGGNTIRVTWFGYNGSLHSVWDTGLILSGHEDIFGRRENNVDQSLVYARLLLENHRGL
ncbi:MAG TPA: S1/P1 nuclease, partial [Pseudobdellovibrionaceae bacterium]|nr:S1/P1 nuclease [Pseudobdellovibrionaceae bacterium]